MVISGLTSSKYRDIGENYLNWTHLRPNRRLSHCSTWYSMPVCDVRVVPTISRMLRAVAADVMIFLYAGWWLWARLCCTWKLPNLSWRPVNALWEHNSA